MIQMIAVRSFMGPGGFHEPGDTFMTHEHEARALERKSLARRIETNRPMIEMNSPEIETNRPEIEAPSLRAPENKRRRPRKQT